MGELKKGSGMSWQLIILVPVAFVVAAFVRVGWALHRNKAR